MSFLKELKRRNVIRVGAAYVVGAWLLIQVAETIFPLFGFDDTPARIVVIVLAIAFVPALIFAWAFELTPEGLKKESEVDRKQSIAPDTGKKLDRAIMVVLVLALGYFGIDKFVLSPERQAAELATATETAHREGRTEALVKSYGDKSIAVLPFVNMSPDPDQAFFADGIAEELLNLLAKIPNLRVTSRSSSFMFRGDALDLPEVAAKLKVAHLLEGSVRKSGNQVRITVQLIEAKSDTHLWSETYDRPLDDIFAIQDEVAERVVEQLRLTLLGDTPKVQPANLDAYALLLEARQIVHLQRNDELSKAEELLKEALQIDPNYVDALNLMHLLYWVQRQAEWPKREYELTRLIEEFQSRVLEIDPDNAEAKAIIAWDLFNWGGNDLAGAARLLEEAAEVDPFNSSVLRGAGVLSSNLGRMGMAIPIFEYLVERDPMTLWNYDNLAKAYMQTGLYEEAIQQYAMLSSLETGEGSGSFARRAGVARLLAGDPAGALRVFEQNPEEWHQLWGKSLALYDLGRKHESAESLERLQKLDVEFLAMYQESLGDTVATLWPEGFAMAYAWTGYPDEAFRYLRAAAEQSGGVSARLAKDPTLSKLHDDPRWLPFLEEFDRLPEQLAEIEFNPRLPGDLSGG